MASDGTGILGIATVVVRNSGERATAMITVPRRSAQLWRDGGWRDAPGRHVLEAGRSVADRRLTVDLRNGTVAG
ncbi:hypothetical protein [Kutzneria sp. CA-103260]|uniref:hypothetical protein n=1 Tax=Kutzneria sp. CA-103260 TaxID=2802641 RepID=UPI001BA59774|nr:hypothetical protein [Kutzneria sp. CA-103260]QUQ65110.1 hypothetical protein JJ691_28310 [Kutzneria sp. CA-103260]